MATFAKTRTDQDAQFYLAEHWSSGRRRKRLDRIERGLVSSLIDPLPDGSLIVDVPCGTGRMADLVRRPGLRVVPMDFNQSMLDAMGQRPQFPHLPFRARANVLQLPLPDKCVDLFLNMRLMHHIEDRAVRVAMYRQIARVTRGRIVTSFWSSRCFRYLRWRLLGKRIRGFPIPPSQFMGVCEEAGLIVERVVHVRRWYDEDVMVVCRPR